MRAGLALLTVLAAPVLAWAGCSRPLQAPVSALGLSVTVHDNTVGGFYPALLQSLGEREGCEFVFTAVPRARQEALFANGRADLLVPASRTPRRDRNGYFIPLTASRAAIVSVNHTRPAIRSLKELRERKELRVALVRGFDYGEAYQELIKDLSAQGRVFFETDPVSVARLLHAGIVDLTVITPATLGGSIMNDTRVDGMLDKLRIELVDDLPWGESGIYVSKTNVTAADRATLERMLGAAVRSGAVFEGLRKQYPPALIEGTLRSK